MLHTIRNCFFFWRKPTHTCVSVVGHRIGYRIWPGIWHWNKLLEVPCRNDNVISNTGRTRSSSSSVDPLEEARARVCLHWLSPMYCRTVRLAFCVPEIRSFFIFQFQTSLVCLGGFIAGRGQLVRERAVHFGINSHLYSNLWLITFSLYSCISLSLVS